MLYVLVVLLTPEVFALPQSSQLSARIIGGEDVALGDIPYQISVRHKGIHKCGGTLTTVNNSTQVVITAAHCVDSGLTYTVVSGTIHRLHETEFQQEMNVSHVIIHELYNGWTYENDIALLVLEKPFNITTKYTKPIKLPTFKEDTDGDVIISGWGSDVVGGDLQDVLKMIEVPVIAREECQLAYSDMADITRSMMCAGTWAKDACLGDAGGPVVSKDKNYLAGIISWGQACADLTHPGVNTKVSYFIIWIDEQLEALQLSP